MQRCKGIVRSQCELKTKMLIQMLGPHVSEDTDLKDLIEPIMYAEQQVYTAKQESAKRLSQVASTFPPLKAHARHLGTRKDGTEAYVYDVKLEDVMARDLHFDPGLYNAVKKSNEAWAKSNAAVGPQTIYDVYHGSEWRNHRHLGAVDVGKDYPTFAWQGYADGVDVVNPIGAAAGHHHMTFFYTTTLNHTPAKRTKQVSIHLAMVVMTKDLKEFTPAAVVSGLPNEPEDSTSLGASLRRFQNGEARHRSTVEPIPN